MPVIEQSGMRLEYPAGDEQSIRADGTVELRVRVIPKHVNNRVWFAYQIDEGQWIRIQATRASTDEEQYFLAVDVSTGRVGLRYMAFVRRGGITVPRGADSTSPDGDQGLRELTVSMSLTDDAASHLTRSDDEHRPDSGAGRPSEATRAKAETLSSRQTIAQPAPEASGGDTYRSRYDRSSEVTMALQVSGKLMSATDVQPSFTGCRIEAVFDLKPAPAPSALSTFRPIRDEILGDATLMKFRSDLHVAPDLVSASAVALTSTQAPIPFQVSALSNAAGNFTLVFPNLQEIASDKVKIVVYSPVGRKIKEIEINAAELSPSITIEVQEFGPTTLDKPVLPTEQTTVRIRGRVIERNGKQLPTSLQVLLLGHEQGTDDANFLTPILVAKADSSGYFSGAIKNLRFDRVVAVVAGIPGEIPVRLVDSLVPPNIPIVVELPNTPASPSSKDCSCSNSAVPRTPTQADIAEAPGAFSADLGTGHCIRFNVPNRAIEEFNFYSVVRTTEPQIVGITVGTMRDNPIPVPGIPPPPPPVGGAPPPPPPVGGVPPPPAGGGATHGATPVTPPAGGGATHGATPVTPHVAHPPPPPPTISAGAADATPPSGTDVLLAPRPPEFGTPYATRIRDFSVDRAASLYSSFGIKQPPGRVPLDGSAPVDWDNTPTFYQAATIAHGHLLHFKQVWYADGYSLGDLLYSLPLAPGQKKLISVVDWERREQTIREEFTSAGEGLQAAFSRDRDLNEVVSGALSESARGGSHNTTVGFGAGKGSAVSGSYEQFNFGGVMGVSGGFGSSDSTAFQDSSRNLSSSSLQTLRDRTLQSASAVRNLRSTIVQTARQGEAVRATTEVVANHNHCHALTIQYFEVLRHFKVTQELADVQECLFVPFPMSEFNRPKVLRWRESLSMYLKRRELAPAFDSARRIETNWSEEYTPAARYADELVSAIFGELTLTILIPLPPFPEKPKPKPEETAEETEAAVRKALAPTEGAFGAILAVATLGASLVVGATADAVSSAAKATAQGARAMAESLVNEPSAEERYARFQQEVMPAAAAGFVDQLELYALVGASEIKLNGADFTLVSDYRPGTPLLVSLRGRLTTPVTRAAITALVIKSSTPLPPGCRAIVNSASLRYQTNHFRHDMVNDQRVNDDIDLPIVTYTGAAFDPARDLLPPGFPRDWPVIPGMTPIRSGNGAMLYTPLDEWEQRSPRLEDIRLSAELIEHLNANLECYHHAIWWTMDPNRRYLLLDGYQAPNADGRSVASVVDNTLIGIIGNSLILPVAPGNHLDPVFRLAKGVTLLEHYDPQSPVPPSRVSLPTRGVFAEAVMGDCNACEEIDDTRFWRWEESPIDEPPALDVTALASRRSEPNYGTPTAFPTPIVSIQNAPQAPDPAGVTAALDTLAKQSFADITGLAGTQANAIAAFSKAMDTALAFGKEASTLAQQAAMTKNIGQTMRAIDKAESEGKIDSEDAKEHRNSTLGQVTGARRESTEDCAKARESEAATKAIENIPGEQITSVATGKTKVTARPSASHRDLVVNVRSEVKPVGDQTGGPLNGNLTISFGLPGTEFSSGGEARHVTFPLFDSVASARISLVPGDYVLRPIYQPASTEDLKFLRSVEFGAAGVDVPTLIQKLFEVVSQNMQSLQTGVNTNIRANQPRLNLLFSAEIRKMDLGNAFKVKLDASAGFSIGADEKVSFDSSKLGDLVAKLAPMLRDPKAIAIGEGVAAFLSLFSVTSNIGADGKLAGGLADSVELTLVPAFLQNVRLTVES